VKRGGCYVRVSLQAEGVLIARLCQGYVTDSGSPSYPNGKNENSLEGPGQIRSITGTNPAAGAQISETVPTGALWKVRGIIATLVTSATTSNRRGQFHFTDGTNILFKSSAIMQTASKTVTYGTASGMGFEDVTATEGFMLALPNDVKLPAGFVITTNPHGFQANDNWGTPQLLVEEWIEP